MFKIKFVNQYLLPSLHTLHAPRQQRESIKFMSLFQRKFVIRKGSIEDKDRAVEFYEIRSNGSSIATTRCIQVVIQMYFTIDL